MKGPLLIVAGAGAGKTKTITHRIVNLIKEGVPPERILAVTFTNKAAEEMRGRISSAIKDNFVGNPFSEVLGSPGPYPGQTIRKSITDSVPFVSTFHSLGVFIIKENAKILKLTRYFSILDEDDSKTLIKEIIKELGHDPKEHSPGKIRVIISIEKGKFVTLENYRQNIRGSFQELVANVWKIYEERKAKENSLDFDDLLLKATKLLKENEQIRKIYQERWEYIHIDEYQDTNEVQYLMSKLLSENNNNIAVVGDTDQCLIKGTKITMADSTFKPIENIKRGDLVLSNYGSGDFRPAKVIGRKNLKFKGNLIKIKTEKGKIITSTPDHIHFAGYRLGLTPQIYLNYLMYKKNAGWRIGTTSIHTKGQKKPVVGFIQRSNQEHADATWVIATHKTQREARIKEYQLSLRYQIPTLPFVPRRGFSINGYVHDNTALKEIFSSFNTENSALKLLSGLGLSRDHPHHQPQARNANRRNINITLCADRRGKNPMHLISTFGNDDIGRKKLESFGFSVRPAKKNTKNWRFETVRADYGEAYLLATKIASVFSETNLILSARLGGMKTNSRDGNSLPHLPASSIMPGMALFVQGGYDIVSKVSQIPTSKIKVFDLDIEKTHNFMANDIVTHNCIYSWRGANLKNILSFEKDYPNAKIILLEENYRSTKNILEAANVIIKKNKYRPEKNLFTKNKSGERIGLYEALNENDEADFVATKILEIMDGSVSSNFFSLRTAKRNSSLEKIEEDFALEIQKGVGSDFLNGDVAKQDILRKNTTNPFLSEIAILYRANFQSRALEEAMLRYNIPYQVLGVKFFERKEIKDTLAYLRAALNRDSLSDIKRIINFPARGIGKATLAKIFATARAGQANDMENLPIKMKIKINNFYKILEEIKIKIAEEKASAVIKFVVKHSGIERELGEGGEEEMERLANIKELATLALKYDNLANAKDNISGIERLLEDAALASDQDSLMISEGVASEKKKNNGVKLMTVHASKGLEFKYVFVVGLEDGLFPARNASRSEAGGPNKRDEETKNKEDSEEERRLFYVAVTRAKEKLFLSFANFRTIFGALQINAPSEFISDIPGNLLDPVAHERRGEKIIYI
ncbi:MAG: DNA helicase II / ATP-dependent DNA helicase PcrA [Parcubacteria group bacterium Gr01-1014_24]|nr:MAG: DNA helicase II / ATP-dependent DNA helicase PcrA [Parcubacteria group bacterium Gr01-1014_24]